ncbi:Cyclin_N domain-containing protein/Cyclin_C domain-containing protein [Cephalotus follicularis]|uniref:B-like cyclin n=1 Tax=Cephalotus follicularis TaxID=3775 RepID=A0A1Q3CKW9_CEPFO|nr:Cyclin_N domain-containing protein/Cyclin_C domain-containing protein [Cephalotus follicularis]
MGDPDNNPFSLSSLLCQEDDSCFKEQIDENDDRNNNPYIVLEENDIEHIVELFERETSTYGSRSFHYSSRISESWLKYSRLNAIEWILNTRAKFGFQFHTAYLSVTYFDRILSMRYIEDGKLVAVRLLSVACLSLAAKMEECNVPLLADFVVEDYNFENNVIKRMEILVLQTLEWKMRSITPFAYLRYFINTFCGESRPQLVSKAVVFVLAIVEVISLVEHRPSIIAAAAVLAASDGHLSRNAVGLKVNLIPSWGSQENEHVFSCYALMQEIEMGKLKTPKTAIDLAIASKTNGIGTKRKLTFNDSDDNFPSRKH